MTRNRPAIVRVILVAWTCLLAGLLATPAAFAQPNPRPVPERDWVPGRLIVRVRAAEMIPMMEQEIAQMGLHVLSRSYTGERLTLGVPVGAEQELRHILKRAPWARWVIQDFASPGGTFTPPPSEMPVPTGGTPHPHNLWFLENTGQTITADGGSTLTGTPGVDINILQAWERTQGDPNVLVAVLDTGIDYSHPEFQGRIYASDYTNFCQSQAYPDCPLLAPFNPTWCLPTPGIEGGATDNFGHGTQVASVLAATADNGIPTVLDGTQFAGVDPGCTLVSFRISYANNFSFGEYLGALDQILNNPNFEDVRVINISHGGFTCPVSEEEDVYTAFEELGYVLSTLYYYRNVFIVTISGNGGVNNNCPNSWGFVVMVGATNNQDDLMTAGSWSSGTSPNLDFVAPGWGMYVAQWGHLCDPNLQFTNGTSLAAPVVSGIASLLYARADTLGIVLTPAMVYECLKQGAVPLGSSPYPNSSYGWGRVNAYESLMKLEELYYSCAADLTHGNTPGVFGYGVPDGDVDADDYNYYLTQWAANNLAVADIASSCSSCGQPGCSTPDGSVTSADLFAYGCLYSAGCP